jgi:hypothetical protein
LLVPAPLIGLSQFIGQLATIGHYSFSRCGELLNVLIGLFVSASVVLAVFGFLPSVDILLHLAAELVKSVTRRIVDRRVLHLIRMWMEWGGTRTVLVSARHSRARQPSAIPMNIQMIETSLR